MTGLAVLAMAGVGLLAGCANPSYDPMAGTTTTTTVTRDAYGNPVASGTTVRDAYGNPVAANSQEYRDAYGRPMATAPGYGATAYPPVDCRASLLHQDRPGGSDYDPRRGAPSC
jgi:hypothetical protein